MVYYSAVKVTVKYKCFVDTVQKEGNYFSWIILLDSQ